MGGATGCITQNTKITKKASLLKGGSGRGRGGNRKVKSKSEKGKRGEKKGGNTGSLRGNHEI